MYYSDNRVYVKRHYILNDIVGYLKENEMLPAICFIFSRKHVELAAKEIQHCLFRDDETQPNTVEKECKKILMSKFPNYKEYLGLPEYNDIVALLKKGVAIHHAGILPVLREMVELLFDKGYVKLLFATETFSVGINMPTKTVIFSTLEKWDGNGRRNLLPHEYTQMAGRAGRRGLDKIGHVIHCNNLFDCGYSHEYKQILCGVPQKLVSKFKINYGLVLSVIASGAKNLEKIEDFVKQSLISREIAKEESSIRWQIDQKEEEKTKLENNLKLARTPKETLDKYIELTQSLAKLNRKKQKKVEREINFIKQDNKFIDKEVTTLNEINKIIEDIDKLKISEKNTNTYVSSEVKVVSNILQEEGFISIEDNEYTLTEKGRSASQLQEVHTLACSDMLEKYDYFDNMSPPEIASVLSMFANIRVSDDKKDITPSTASEQCNNAAVFIEKQINHYVNIELRNYIDSGENCDCNYDLMETIIQWYQAESEEACKYIVQKLSSEKEIFLGDFIKAILKINNISAEIEKIAEMKNNIPLLEKLRLIPSNTLKYVATNQSLYI